MAKTGVVEKPFPYSTDGVNVENLAEGRVFSFPDKIFEGLKAGGFVADSSDVPENSVIEAAGRDLVNDEADRRLMVASDAELKTIIARSGSPVSGNLVHAVMVEQAKLQLQREAAGKEPILGVDPMSGITEHPLAAPGSPTPPSAPALVAAVKARADAAGRAGVATGAGIPAEDGKSRASKAKTEA